MKQKSYKRGHPHQPGHETHNQRSRVVASNTWEHWSPCQLKWGQPRVFRKRQRENIDMWVVTYMEKKEQTWSQKNKKGSNSERICEWSVSKEEKKKEKEKKKMKSNRTKQLKKWRNKSKPSIFCLKPKSVGIPEGNEWHADTGRRVY